jgi:hypothetical protein
VDVKRRSELLRSARAREALMLARRCVALLVAAVAGCARSSGSPTDAGAEALPLPSADARAEARAALVDDASDGWLNVPGAADLAEPGASPVSIQVRRSKTVGSGCGGGGCSSDLDARSFGVLPARSFGWFWPDRSRRPTAKGCPDVPELGSLFRTWTMIEIAPAAETLTRGGHCGLGVNADGGVRYWVILRIGPAAPARTR